MTLPGKLKISYRSKNNEISWRVYIKGIFKVWKVCPSYYFWATTFSKPYSHFLQNSTQLFYTFNLCFSASFWDILNYIIYSFERATDCNQFYSSKCKRRVWALLWLWWGYITKRVWSLGLGTWEGVLKLCVKAIP